MSADQRQYNESEEQVDIASGAADPFKLYVAAVQNPTETVQRCTALFKKQHGARPRFIREDFCGTAANCIAWLHADEHARLVGVDHDTAPLQWCREQLLTEMQPQDQERLQLIHANVMDPGLPQAELILAMNGSFCAIKKRPELLQYMNQCREALSPRGMLIMEVYAGPESQMTGKDILPRDGFTATWEQETFNAVTNETTTHLHFRFPDGHEMRRAFSYDWRLWSPAELLDAMREVGFSNAEVYPVTTDRDQSLSPCTSADVRTHWTVYTVGWS